MVTGVIQAGSSLGILVPPSVVLVLYGMIARQPVGQLWLAGAIPGLMMAVLFIVYIAVRCRLQPHLGPVLPREERQVPLGEKMKLLRAGVLPFLIFFSMTGLFLMGYTSLVESSAVGAVGATPRGALQGPAQREGHGSDDAQDPRGELHVHVDHPRRALFRRGVRRAGRGTRDRGLLPRTARARPLAGADPDAALVPADGHLSRRHRDAGDRRAALRAAGQGPRLRSHLVRGALHHHLPDRVHDAALRLQPVPDAGDGAARNRTRRHLPLHHPLRAGDGGGPGPGDDLSRSSRCGCRSSITGSEVGKAHGSGAQGPDHGVRMVGLGKGARIRGIRGGWRDGNAATIARGLPAEGSKRVVHPSFHDSEGDGNDDDQTQLSEEGRCGRRRGRGDGGGAGGPRAVEDEDQVAAPDLRGSPPWPNT